jgi:hypothetical protein
MSLRTRALVAIALATVVACRREEARTPETSAGSSTDSTAVTEAQASPATDTTPRSRTSATTDSLVAAFRRAHERRDVPALLALFHADCATPEMRALTETSLRSHLDDPIQAARVEPPLPTRVKSYERGGKRYELSVPLEGELVVVYDTATGRRSSYPLGSVGGVPKLGTMCAR